ncbi:MAG: hypothetical protein ACTTKZ_06935 [Bacteroides sp.]
MEAPSEADLDRIEQWQDYLENPIELNTASLSLLRSLPFLKEGEPEALIAFRNIYREFAAVTDLLWVENIARDRATELLPFFYVRESAIGVFHRQQIDVLQRASYRAERGVKTKKNTLGAPLALETRIDYHAGDVLRLALRGRKQPYEPFGTRFNPYGYPSYAGFLQTSFSGKWLERVVLGHFSYLAGYGLTFSSSNYFFPTQNPLSFQGDRYLPRGCFATPSSATPFGLAVTSGLGSSLLLTLCFSYRPLNATYREQNGTRFLRTVDISGAFDTPVRQKWRNATRETLGVLDLKWQRRYYALGIANAYDYFRDPFLASTTSPTAELKLQSQWRVGLYGQYRWKRFKCWAEFAEGDLQSSERWTKVLERNSALWAAEYATVRYGTWSAELYRYGAANPSRYQRNFSRSTHPRGRWGANLYYNFRLLQGTQFAATYRFHRSFLDKVCRHEVEFAADLPFSTGCSLFLRYKTYYRTQIYTMRHDVKVRFLYPLTNSFIAISQCQVAAANPKDRRKLAPPSIFLSQRVDYRTRSLTIACLAAVFYGGEHPAVIYYGEPSFRYTSPIHSLRKTGGRLVLLSHVRFGKYWTLGCRFGGTIEAQPWHITSYDAQLQLAMAWKLSAGSL